MTIALKVLIDLPPLHTVAKTKGFATADRLVQNRKWPYLVVVRVVDGSGE